MKRDAIHASVQPALLHKKTLYTSADLTGVPHLDSLPGTAPFLRGPHRSMYTGKPWTIRQYGGFGDAAQTNALFRGSLAAGAQGLSVAFDLPTHRGYDSNHPLASADAGLAGVAIDSVDDMRELFEGIDLGTTSVSMTMSGAVLPVLAAFLVAADEAGVPASRVTGTIQNDILKEFMVRNTYIHAPEPSLRIAADVVAWLGDAAPRFNAISISGYHLQEAGADPALELALTMANAGTYLARFRAAGLDIEQLCGQVSFFFGVGRDFYAEVAKLRAARLVWHEIATAHGAVGDRARALRMHCQTSGWTLSAHAQHNNIARTTIQAMAAVFGGTQSLHTNSHDEALALPGEEAAALARNMQHILQRESGLCDVIDPWAGSYMMERLTHDMAQRCRALIREIDLQGGVVPAIESGWVREEIARAASFTQAGIDSGAFPVVGQNLFTDDTAYPAPTERRRVIDGDAVRAAQAARIAAVRAKRDGTAVARALARLETCARGGQGNLLSCAMAAMRSRATVGECVEALERVWPRYRTSVRWQASGYGTARAADERWQRILDAVADCTSRRGRPPRVLIAKLGQDGHDRGAMAVAGALADAGFDVVTGPLFQQPDDAAALAVSAAVDIVGVSSLAGAHVALLGDLSAALRKRGLGHLALVAGGVIPQSDHARLHACGVVAIFTPGTSMDDVIEGLLALL